MDEEFGDEIEEQEAEEIKPQSQIVARVQDRIKLLKHRCEAGLGSNLSERVIQFLKTSKSKVL